jgi:hypothetical protein
MKTPHAVLIGLSLIAAAIYFKEPFVKPAHAFGGPDHIACDSSFSCWAFDGDIAKRFIVSRGVKDPVNIINWKTGKRLLN